MSAMQVIPAIISALAITYVFSCAVIEHRKAAERDQAMEHMKKAANAIDELAAANERLRKLSRAASFSADEVCSAFLAGCSLSKQEVAINGTLYRPLSVRLGSVEEVNMSDYTALTPTSPPLSPRTCPNCGAPVSGSVCEYCGSVFEKQGNPEIIGQYHGKPVITHGERTVRRYNPDRGIWEYVVEETT